MDGVLGSSDGLARISHKDSGFSVNLAKQFVRSSEKAWPSLWFEGDRAKCAASLGEKPNRTACKFCLII
jgi:hypothetical protein